MRIFNYISIFSLLFLHTDSLFTMNPTAAGNSNHERSFHAMQVMLRQVQYEVADVIKTAPDDDKKVLHNPEYSLWAAMFAIRDALITSQTHEYNSIEKWQRLTKTIKNNALNAYFTIVQGANVNTSRHVGSAGRPSVFPLTYAIENGCPAALIQILLETADLEKMDKEKKPALLVWYRYYYHPDRARERHFGDIDDALDILDMLLAKHPLGAIDLQTDEVTEMKECVSTLAQELKAKQKKEIATKLPLVIASMVQGYLFPAKPEEQRKDTPIHQDES